MTVEVIEGFMDAATCLALIELARPRLYKSKVWDVATGGEKEDDYRVSEQTFFGRGETELIRTIEDAIESVTGISAKNGEGIQVLHYNPGGYYKPHYDYFDPAFEGNKNVLLRGGQRAATFMVYLCDVEEGGGTSFPQMNFMGAPKTGRALFWKNVKEDGSPDPDTLHAAEPVIRGEKWIFTKWLREKEFL